MRWMTRGGKFLGNPFLRAPFLRAEVATDDAAEDAEWVLFVLVARSLALKARSFCRATRSRKGAHEEGSLVRLLFNEVIREGSFCTRSFFLQAFSFAEAMEEYGDRSLGGGCDGELLLLTRIAMRCCSSRGGGCNWNACNGYWNIAMGACGAGRCGGTVNAA